MVRERFRVGLQPVTGEEFAAVADQHVGDRVEDGVDLVVMRVGVVSREGRGFCEEWGHPIGGGDDLAAMVADVFDLQPWSS